MFSTFPVWWYSSGSRGGGEGGLLPPHRVFLFLVSLKIPTAKADPSGGTGGTCPPLASLTV